MFPETSLGAYHALTPEKVKKDHEKIFLALSNLWEAIYDEIARYLNEKDVNMVSRRLKEMEEMELIKKTGRKRRTSRNRSAFTYQVIGCQLAFF